MPAKYYMDVHVPAAVTAGLRRRRVDVLTSQEDGTREVEDDALLTRATELGRVLFTQDQDLLRIASDWQAARHHFSGVIFASQQRMSIGHCIEELELLAECCTQHELSDRVIFLPLK